MDKLSLKYYEVFLVGVPKTDAQGVPVSDPKLVSATNEKGLIPEWIRTGNPSTEVIAAIGKGRFIQTQMMEVTSEEPFKKLGGVVMELGPMVDRAKTVVIFESRYKAPFQAIEAKIAAGKVDLITGFTTKQLGGGKTLTTCIGKIAEWAMPGYHLKQGCGFDHYLYQRNATTHKLEKRLTPGWGDDGRWDNNKCATINWVDIFLFANELDAADALIKAEMDIAAQFKPPATGDKSHVS
jgi:hypothetical protein